MNDIFRQWNHSDIFYRFLFNSSAEILALFTAKNINVLSAKSFILDIMLSGIEKHEYHELDKHQKL